jgi:flagellar motor switch protein FliG
MDPSSLPGSLKTAILLQSLGEDASQIIMKGLSEQERLLMHEHLSQMGRVSPELAEKVAQEFAEMAGGSRNQAKNAAPGERGKGSDAETAGSGEQGSSLEVLKSLEPEVLVELVKDEHPQTIAIILVHLSSETASEILVRLPEDIQADVALRIASLDKVVSVMVEEIGKVFDDMLKKKKGSVTHKTGGVGCLAEILNQTDGMSAQALLDELEEDHPELVAEVKQRMFVFEDLILVDDKGLQKLLRSVETKELATALKAATDEVKQKIFKNMSERAKEMLEEEIEALGAVRMKEVEDSQQAITKIIQDMEAKGEIVISGRKGEELIG